MAENFDLIFGQNASQQYAWNDADYQNGWETIGNIPPTAGQFDALQRRSDMKTQELNSRLANVEQSIAGGEGQKREPDTEYTVGTIKTYDDVPFNWVLECIVGGTSGSADITIPSPAVEGARIIDGNVTWALRKIATYGGVGYRQSSTSCPIGSMAFSTALPAGWYLECTTPGTTSAGDLVITSPAIGNTVTDGTVVWKIRAVASTADIPAPVDISGKANTSLNNLTTAGENKIKSLAQTASETGFTIIYPNNGSASNPATVTAQSRYVMSNPFPGYYVECHCELLIDNKWTSMNRVSPYSTTPASQGLYACLYDRNIVLQTGGHLFFTSSAQGDGRPGGSPTSTTQNTAPCRIWVWKVGKM